MKARLLIYEDNLILIKQNGDSTLESLISAREFLLNFTDEKYYPGRGTPFYYGPPMEEYRGETIAFVNDAGELVIQDAARYKDIIVKGESDFLSVSEYAEIHGKSVAMVRRLCQNGRIDGAVLRGKYYWIPSNAQYPKA